MYTADSRSLRQITLLLKARSTRHDAVKHDGQLDGQLVTRFYDVTSWPCDELTGSLLNHTDIRSVDCGDVLCSLISVTWRRIPDKEQGWISCCKTARLEQCEDELWLSAAPAPAGGPAGISNPPNEDLWLEFLPCPALDSNQDVTTCSAF